MLKIKLAITNSGYRQNWVAEQIGIDPSLLSRYVSGERSTPEDVIKKVAKLLKTTPWSIKGNVEL